MCLQMWFDWLRSASCLVAIACGFSVSAAAVAGDGILLHRPVAIDQTHSGKTIVVASRGRGSVTLLDRASRRVEAEFSVARSLCDLAVHPDGRHLLAVDDAAHELLILELANGRVTVTKRLAVSRFPVDVEIATDGSICTVTSLWSRCVTIVRLDTTSAGTLPPRVAATVALPFAPRGQVLIPHRGQAIIADSFGGRIAVVNTDSGKLDLVRELPGHNIRGLAIDPAGRRLWIAHQILNHLAQPTRGDIHWGVLMSNGLRSLDLSRLLDGSHELLEDSRFVSLGDGSRGAGDPAGFAFDDRGRIVVALSGVNEVSVLFDDAYRSRRIPTGRRPAAVVTIPEASEFWVANTFSDSVSVVESFETPDDSQPSAGPSSAGSRKLVFHDLTLVAHDIPLGASRPLTPAERGELLFHDARLSHANWFSCHSCHTDGHTSNQLADTLGDGDYGAPKRIPSLLGVRDTDPWAWNGTVKQLQEQVHRSVQSTMQGRAIPAERADDLVAYMRTLQPPPGLADSKTGGPFAESVARGRKVFSRQGCARCHTGRTYTTHTSYNVGLADALGNERFNPPSLRGVSQRSSFFHDGRAESLRDVFTTHEHQIAKALSGRELDDLVRYLQHL